MKKVLIIALTLVTIKTIAQNDTTKVLPAAANTNPLSFNGYVEAYYSYDFNEPKNNNKAGFIYNHNKHNEFNINLAFLRASYNNDKIRGTVAIGVGSYMNANYAAEPGTLKNIYEANAGIRIGRKNCWIDAGILPSHIGFESAVSKDCGTITRCIMAENTPYFHGGVRIGYTTNNGKWYLSGLLLNGWQRITRVEANSMMSFGTQVQFKPTATTTLNYSTFIGTDKPDSARLIRIYHNIYGIFQVSKKWGVTAGFDVGTEQKAKGSSSYNTVYSPVIIAKYTPNNKWAFAARAEYYDDENGVMIATGTAHGFKTSGFSFNIDYSPFNFAVVRLEAKTYNSRDAIFTKGFTTTYNNTFITSSIAISL